MWLGVVLLSGQWMAALLGFDSVYHWWVIPREAIIVLNPLIFVLGWVTWKRAQREAAAWRKQREESGDVG